jgi:hypothetical protein
LEENWVQKTSGKAYLHTFSKLGRKVSGTVSGNTYTVIMYSCYVTMWVLLAFLGTCTPSKCGINILQTLFSLQEFGLFSQYDSAPLYIWLCVQLEYNIDLQWLCMKHLVIQMIASESC